MKQKEKCGNKGILAAFYPGFGNRPSKLRLRFHTKVMYGRRHRKY